jgi:tol-pal system protein YbgF
MILSVKRSVAATVLLSAVTLASLQSAVAASTSDRLDSIERKLDARGLLDMLNRVEQMQRDIQQLRGDIEVLTHKEKELQRRSREQYLDIDRRLQQLESGAPGLPAAVTPPVAPPSVAPPPVVTTPPGQVDPLNPPPMTRPPGAATIAPPPQPLRAGEREAYDNGLAVLREGRYAEAAQSFNRFLVDYPGSSFADNASYWLGETYYVTRDFDQALATFDGLVQQYPDSLKAADSRLKTGYIYYEKKDWKQARQTLEAVVSEYPGSTAARLAGDRLKRMKSEGH